MKTELFNNVFFEFSLILVVAAAIGMLARLLKQPLIVSFIIAGIILSPAGLGLMTSFEAVHLFSDMGIAILLFIVGLKLDIKIIRHIGPVAMVAGLSQVIITALFAYGVGIALGLEHLDALYCGAALAFSSTIIIIKMLTDKKEIDSLYGQISVGILIVQDVVVILLMIVLSAFGKDQESTSILHKIGMVLLKGGLLFVISALLRSYVIPFLSRKLANSQELLVLFAVAWAVSLASIVEMIGFSKEVGSFIAGITFASTTYREIIASRLIGLRDFLLLFFAVDLGSRLDIHSLSDILIPGIILSLFVLFIKPFIVVVIMGLMGHRKRTGFLTGITLGQVSEFSLIFIAVGNSIGHINNDTMNLITMVALVTIIFSTYIMMYAHQLFKWSSSALTFFERKNPKKIDIDEKHAKPDAVIFGLGRYGGNISKIMTDNGYNLMGIDFDPKVIKQWEKQHWPVQYGDVEDMELMASPEIQQTKYIISTLPDAEINITLLKYLGHIGYKGKVVVTAHTEQDEKLLKEAGADLILLPFEDAAENIPKKLQQL